MKKSKRIISMVLAGLMLVSATPVVSAAQVKVAKPKVSVSNTSSGVKISWKKAKGAKKYVVFRKLSTAKKYTTIKTVKKAGSFTDKKAKEGKKYLYKVKAVNGKLSAASSAKTIIRLKAPVLSDSTKKDGSVSIKWKKIKGAKKYEVYCAEVKNGKTGAYKKIKTTQNNSYADFSYQNAILRFKVRAVNGSHKSTFSKVIKVDYIADPYLSAIIALDFSCIELTWKSIKGVDGYRIYRSTDAKKRGELWKDLKEGDCIVDTSFTAYKSYILKDTDVKDNVIYYYTMVAYDDKRESIESISSERYRSAYIVVKVGETSKEFFEIFGDMKEYFESKGYTVEYSSDNESIFKVDENYNIIGVAEGTANLVEKVTYKTGVSSGASESRYLVKVLPADKTDTSAQTTPTQ